MTTIPITCNPANFQYSTGHRMKIVCILGYKHCECKSFLHPAVKSAVGDDSVDLNFQVYDPNWFLQRKFNEKWSANGCNFQVWSQLNQQTYALSECEPTNAWKDDIFDGIWKEWKDFNFENMASVEDAMGWKKDLSLNLIFSENLTWIWNGKLNFRSFVSVCFLT